VDSVAGPGGGGDPFHPYAVAAQFLGDDDRERADPGLARRRSLAWPGLPSRPDVDDVLITAALTVWPALVCSRQ